jgi:hypothetical protein
MSIPNDNTAPGGFRNRWQDPREQASGASLTHGCTATTAPSGPRISPAARWPQTGAGKATDGDPWERLRRPSARLLGCRLAAVIPLVTEVLPGVQRGAFRPR